MASDNIESTVKIKFDNSELKQGLSEANSQIKLANSEFKAASDGTKEWAASEEGLIAKKKQLTEVLTAQQSKMEAYQKAMEQIDTSTEQGAKEAERLQVTMNNLQGSINRTEAELGRIDNALEEVGDESADTAKKMETLQEGTEKINSFMEKLGTVLVATVAAGVTAFGKLVSESVKAAGDLEQQMGGVEAVFGEHADKMVSVAENAYSNMGLSTNDFLEVANRMGAILQGVGFDAEESMTLTADVMQRAADVASIMGVDLSSAMEAVTGAAKGNYTMMDNLGVAMNDTSLAAYALEKGLIDSNAEWAKLPQNEKIAAAMQMFMEKTAYAAGNFANENKTLSGSMEVLNAAWENFLATGSGTDQLAESVMNALQAIGDMVKELAPKLIQGIKDMFEQHGPEIANQVANIIGEIVSAIFGSDMVGGAVSKGLELIIGNLDKFITIIGIATAATTAYNAVMKIMAGWSIIQGVIEGITAVVKGLTLAEEAGTAAKVAYTVAQTAANVAAGAFAVITSPITAIVLAVVAAIALLAEGLTRVIGGFSLFEKITDKVKSFFGGTKDSMDETTKASDDMTDSMTSDIDALMEQYQNGEFAAGDYASSLTNTFSGLASDLGIAYGAMQDDNFDFNESLANSLTDDMINKISAKYGVPFEEARDAILNEYANMAMDNDEFLTRFGEAMNNGQIHDAWGNVITDFDEAKEQMSNIYTLALDDSTNFGRAYKDGEMLDFIKSASDTWLDTMGFTREQLLDFYNTVEGKHVEMGEVMESPEFKAQLENSKKIMVDAMQEATDTLTGQNGLFGQMEKGADNLGKSLSGTDMKRQWDTGADNLETPFVDTVDLLTGKTFPDLFDTVDEGAEKTFGSNSNLNDYCRTTAANVKEQTTKIKDDTKKNMEETQKAATDSADKMKTDVTNDMGKLADNTKSKNQDIRVEFEATWGSQIYTAVKNSMQYVFDEVMRVMDNIITNSKNKGYLAGKNFADNIQAGLDSVSVERMLTNAAQKAFNAYEKSVSSKSLMGSLSESIQASISPFNEQMEKSMMGINYGFNASSFSLPDVKVTGMEEGFAFLAREIQGLKDYLNFPIILDSGELVGSLGGAIDTTLQRRHDMNARGVNSRR